MKLQSLDDLRAFTLVAQEGSFTRAAAIIGITPSALSQTIRTLESRLGLRLLARTTRSVAPTEAGEHLLKGVLLHIEGIDAEIRELKTMLERPSGTIRITTDEFAAYSVIWPVIEEFMRHYQDINFEISVDYGLTDIVAERYDAGVRLGDIVGKNMIALPITADTRMIVVGAPDYFAARTIPNIPADLTEHECINFRLATHQNLYAWEFQKGDHKVNVRVEGRLIFNSLRVIMAAALSGAGLCYLPEEEVHPYLINGTLRQVLDDWCPRYPGYHLYYPNRRYHPPAFALFIDALRSHTTIRKSSPSRKNLSKR